MEVSGSGIVSEVPSSGSVAEVPSSGIVAEVPSSGIVVEVPSSGILAEVPSSGIVCRNDPTCSYFAKYQNSFLRILASFVSVTLVNPQYVSQKSYENKENIG